MKQYLICLLAWMIFTVTNAQVYDLIVTDNGDSIACQIDQITEPALYFKMKYNNSWINTSIPTEEVVTYEYDAVDRREIVFREGSSYIASIKSPQSLPTNLYEIRKNSVYLEYELFTVSLSYERIFPIRNSIGLVVAGGISPGMAFTEQGFYARGKVGLLMGGPRHSFETGVMAFTAADFGPFILAGYRYMAYKGFLFRIGIGFNLKGDEEFYLLPGLSLGYSF